MLFQMKPEQLGIDVSDLPPEIRDKVTVQDLGIIRQMQKYCNGQEADTRAFSEILDRYEGRPVQKIEADVQTVTAEDINLDQALELVQSKRKKKS